MKQYKFNRNYLNLLIENKDELLDNDLVILVTYIEVLQDKIEAYENMRKEAIDYVEEKGRLKYNPQDLLNILNKVGGSDE